MGVAQHSVQRAPDLRQPRHRAAGAECARIMVVGLLPEGKACGFSGGLLGLKLVPSKRRHLVPPTSTPNGITHTVSLLNNVSIQFVEKKLCYSGTNNPL